MNVVLIEADQLSAKWLGCYGCPAAYTPNIDGLASRGTRFENCFSNHPVCMPSRATALTGRSAHHHGVFYNGWELDPGIPTFPRLLQSHGIQTFGVGKFHLECHGRSAYNDVLKYGFDRAEVTEDIRAGDWLDWVEREHPQDAQAALATVWPTPHLNDYGPNHRDLNREIMTARKQAGKGPRATEGACTQLPEELCQTSWIVQRAISFLEQRDPTKPFYLNVSFVDPHDPYDPPTRFLDMVDNTRISPIVSSEDPTLQVLVQRLRANRFVASFERLSDADWRQIRHHYLASVSFIDEQVGRLLQALDGFGLADDTAVLLTADHGDMLGDHELPTKGSWHFDACVRVPMLMTVPGESSGPSCDRAVSTLDLFPTVCDLAGVSCDVPVEGVSLRAVSHDRGDCRPNAVLVESYGAYRSRTGPFRARSIMTPTARFTRFGDGFTMLFDTRNDPDELTNLAGRPESRGLQADLTDLMLTLWDRQNEPPPDRYRHPTASH